MKLLFLSSSRFTLAFTWLKLSHIYPPELRSVNLDAEWVYRRLVPDAARATLRRLVPTRA